MSIRKINPDNNEHLYEYPKKKIILKKKKNKYSLKKEEKKENNGLGLSNLA